MDEDNPLCPRCGTPAGSEHPEYNDTYWCDECYGWVEHPLTD